MRTMILLAATVWEPLPVHAAEPVPPATNKELAEFQSRLLATTTKHLDLLLDTKGKVKDLKGKSADAYTAFAFYHVFEITGNQKYRAAAVELADRIVKDMKAMKFGVLYIKEKDKGNGVVIPGGGPPAFGWYTATAAYILHKEGGRNDDVKYIATTIDNFPWNPEGWWSADIDTKTGISKVPLTKPSPVNKNAAMAMAAATVGEYVKDIDPVLSARLKAKAETCVYNQIIPAQEGDGFWHYGLTENDPKNKDILGYFMVTMHALLRMQQETGSYHDRAFQASLDKADEFTRKYIAPITEPNKGPPLPPNRTNAMTPKQYTLANNDKRGYVLGYILIAGKKPDEGVKLLDFWSRGFPYGNAGMDGAHAVEPTALILARLKK